MFEGADVPEAYTVSQWTKKAKTELVLWKGVELKDNEDDNIVNCLVILNKEAKTLVERATLHKRTSSFDRKVIDVSMVEFERMLKDIDIDLLQPRKLLAPGRR